MKRSLLATLSLLALALLAWICSSFHAPLIEEEIKDRLLANLFARDLDTVQVKISGRDVHLSGQLETADAANLARQIAKNTAGVRKLTHTLEIASHSSTSSTSPTNSNADMPEAKRPQLLFLYDGTQLQIEGFGNANLLSELKTFVKEQHGFENILPKLEEWPGQAADWSVAARELASALLSLEQGEALLEKDRWQLFGNVLDSGQKTKIQSQLFKAMPSHFKGGLDLKLHLSKTNLACQHALDNLLRGQKLLFLSNSAEITPESKPVLEQITRIIRGCPQIYIKIAGHTDASGHPKKNQNLSQNRANAVTSFLIQAGIDSEKITATGFGSAWPIASNENEKGRAQNRRIEIIVMETPP